MVKCLQTFGHIVYDKLVAVVQSCMKPKNINIWPVICEKTKPLAGPVIKVLCIKRTCPKNTEHLVIQVLHRFLTQSLQHGQNIERILVGTHDGYVVSKLFFYVFRHPNMDCHYRSNKVLTLWFCEISVHLPKPHMEQFLTKAFNLRWSDTTAGLNQTAALSVVILLHIIYTHCRTTKCICDLLASIGYKPSGNWWPLHDPLWTTEFWVTYYPSSVYRIPRQQFQINYGIMSTAGTVCSHKPFPHSCSLVRLDLNHNI